MNQPLISIITICYNAEDCIEKTILSVINQAYQNIEYIIIDGKSTDGTMDIVNKYKDRISTIVSEKDAGVYDAMNKGITYATGKWVNFMNAGDTFANTDVLKQVFENKEYKENVAIIQGDNIGIYKAARNTCLTSYQSFRTTNLRDNPQNGAFCHQAIFVRQDVIRNYPFNTKYKVMADHDQLRRIVSSNVYVAEYLPFPFCYYDFSGLSSLSFIQLTKEEYALGKISKYKYYRRLCRSHITTRLPKGLRFFIRSLIIKRKLKTKEQMANDCL